MRDDIPTLLRDAAADPSHTPDFDALAARGRRQHLLARAGTALVAVVALVAGGIVLWPDGQPTRGPVIGDQPSTPDAADEPVTLPANWHEIQVGDATFGVPAEWTVESFTEPADVCPNEAGQPTAFVLHAGPRAGGSRCLAVAQRVLAVQAAPLATIPPVSLEPEQDRTWNDITTPGGVAGQRLVRNDNGTIVAYRFPELDLWLQFSDGDTLTTQADDILATLHSPGTSSAAGGSLTTPRPVADDPAPVVRAGAAGTKIDCDGSAHLGAWALDAGGPPVGAANPRAALEAFLADSVFGFALPDEGYEQVASEPGRVLFTYAADGQPKVAVIVADGTVVDERVNTPDGWGFEVFATCDPAEYAPTADAGLEQTVWTDRDGNRVPTSTITTMQGDAHCDWQTVTFLHLNDQQYLRDPQHLLSGSTVRPYDGDAQLPADASDTGFRRGSDELWLADDGTVAYLVTDSGVEAWPSTTGMVGCR